MDKTLSTTENLDGDGPVPAVVTPKPQTPTSGAFVFPTTAVNIAARHRFRDDNPAAVTSSLVVVAVEHQHDRTIIYGKDIHYHVVAPKNAPVTEGDTIECEPYGANFGWFVRVLST